MKQKSLIFVVLCVALIGMSGVVSAGAGMDVMIVPSHARVSEGTINYSVFYSNYTPCDECVVTWSTNNSRGLIDANSGVMQIVKGEATTIKVMAGNYSLGINLLSAIVEVCDETIGCGPTPVTNIVSRYAGSDGIVQRSEAVQAVIDYFDVIITKQEVINVVVAYFATQAPTPVESLLVPIVVVDKSRIININGSEVNEFGDLVRGALINFEISIQNPGSDNIAIESMVIAKNTIDGNMISVPRVYSSETFVGTRKLTEGSSWYTNTGTAVDSVITFSPSFTIKAGQTVQFSIEMDTSNTEPVQNSTIQFSVVRAEWIVFSADGTQPSVEQYSLFNQQGEVLTFNRY